MHPDLPVLLNVEKITSQLKADFALKNVTAYLHSLVKPLLSNQAV